MPASSVIPQHIPTPVCRADPTTRSLGRLGSAPRLLLIGCVALIVLIAGMRAWVCWGNDAWLNHPAGVLIAMASDLKAGIFYRPIYGPAGYGGTRYFPLYFVLQAALMKLGMPILLSAYVLSAAAMAALLAGMFCLLRALGVGTLARSLRDGSAAGRQLRAVCAVQPTCRRTGMRPECMGAGFLDQTEAYPWQSCDRGVALHARLVSQAHHRLWLCRGLRVVAGHSGWRRWPGHSRRKPSAGT